MESRISKWGNSLGIRIPNAIAKDVGISENTVIDLQAEKNRIIISKSKKYSLKQLLAQITPQNRHSEIETDAPVGKELW